MMLARTIVSGEYQRMNIASFSSLVACVLATRNSMNETVSCLAKISHGLETGSYDSTNTVEQQAKKPSIHLIAEQLKTIMNESDLIRGRLELKDEELLDVKKMLKLKHDELSELNIRLSLNEKKIESLQKELDEKANKHKQTLEEARMDGQKKIKSVVQ
jgi:dynactin 1